MGIKMQSPVDTASSTVSTIITDSSGWIACFHVFLVTLSKASEHVVAIIIVPLS
jgi:hypothetical protein